MPHLFWPSVLMFNSFISWPAAFVFLIYSFGAMVLRGEWQLFLWAVVAFGAGFVIEMAVSLIAE